jgi:hypothetical protein
MNATDEQDDPGEASAPVVASTALKSMNLFFIDNQVSWSDKAVLAGDLVLWPDDNKYPSFVPVASARHPNFDGTIVVLAGNRHIIVSLCEGAYDSAGVRKTMSAKGDAGPEQYGIAIDGIIQRVLLWRETDGGLGHEDGVHPFALLQWMQRSHPAEAAVIRKALDQLYAKPVAFVYVTKDGQHEFLNREQVHEHVEGMLDQLSATLGPADIVKPVAGDGATTTTTE